MRLGSFYPKRDKWSHKGDFGYVLAVSGSFRYTGSPVFLSMAAIRSGADIVTVIGPERAMNIAANFTPDIITIPITDEGVLGMKHVQDIIELADHFDSLVIGPGLDGGIKTQKAVVEIIKNVDIPMVVDADAIRAVKSDLKILKYKEAIITPHSGEFEDLTEETLDSDVNNRKEMVERWATKLNSTILLKGHVDIISNGEETKFNKTGSPYMTKGGFGDTLSGICGSLLARGKSPFDAALAGAYINGKAGELAAKEYGESIMASDIFEFIPDVIN